MAGAVGGALSDGRPYPDSRLHSLSFPYREENHLTIRNYTVYYFFFIPRGGTFLHERLKCPFGFQKECSKVLFDYF